MELRRGEVLGIVGARVEAPAFFERLDLARRARVFVRFEDASGGWGSVKIPCQELGARRGGPLPVRGITFQGYLHSFAGGGPVQRRKQSHITQAILKLTAKSGSGKIFYARSDFSPWSAADKVNISIMRRPSSSAAPP